MSDETPSVVVRAEGGVARVILARPERRNAFDAQMVEELTAAFARLSRDTTCRVIVVEGEGKAFCAGADLEWMRRQVTSTVEENTADALKLADLYEAVNCAPQAVIAKVHGWALGGGAGLVCAADVAVAADDAMIGFTEARLGILPAVISPYVVMKIGAGQARRWFVTGARMDAKQALALGLVHRVVAAADLENAVRDMTFEVLQCAPGAVAACKELVEDVVGGLAMAGALEEGFADVKNYTAQRIAQARVSEEGQEGLRAFLEKRKPRWAQ
jgi:methylglutaconyl-CoA hydratase